MTNRLTSPHKRAERTCALVGSAGNPAIELDLIEWDYGDLTSERCASAIVTPRSDALQPSSQCGSPGAMRFSHRYSAEARSDALQPSFHPATP